MIQEVFCKKNKTKVLAVLQCCFLLGVSSVAIDEGPGKNMLCSTPVPVNLCIEAVLRWRDSSFS